MVDDGTLALRLLLAAVLGAVVGVERESRDQPAGLRTHLLVSVGACLFTLVSAYGFEEFTLRDATEAVRADVTRIASQVVVGIGFIGGGAILRYGGTIKGLTTAASLWVTAAIGLAVGAGMYVMAAMAAGLAIVALWMLKPVERKLFPRTREEPGPED